ncbi:uncharacterized protein LOC132730737 isoform X3 [Ruditapes philippinarum]|uniref:uncharacterized protein LOC132730737 isoform X3 n=1 Tax=Ruditapes philippinarum TaxID=129788 RepID=UPI00295AE8B0|nr:uncharacterized protein LOC132730737 isoform X3 [Ruditapes philippinarum]
MEISSSKNCDITRGHEHYLCHILLLGQASPIALKAIIEREKKNCGKDIGILLNEYSGAFKIGYETEYLQLLQGDHVNDDIDTWDTLQLCAVTLVLFKSDLEGPEIKAIQHIYDQRKDIEKYAKCASLSFKTYKEKQDLVHEQLLELIKRIDQSANYNCKRMMYSFEPESINLSESQVCKLTGTKDVKTHLQVAIEVNFETQSTLTGEDNTQVLHTNDQIFIEELQNKIVYINDSVVLRCKLNTPVGDNVEWRKDCKLIKITDNMVFMSNHCTHWLSITQASVEDTGKYSCVCGHISTSADLTVIDEALSVVIDLPIKSEVIENGNIDIECKVNLLTLSKPVWRYKGKILESSDRYVILAKGTTHKLTVMNVTFQEEGEYTVDFGKVSSKTTLIVQGDKEVLHRNQLIEKLYRNWVRGALALKYLKVGLEAFSDKAVKSQHDDIVSAFKGACNSCTEKSLIPHKQDQCPRQKKHLCLCSINTKNKKHKSTKMCPNGGYCGKFYDRIVCDHRFHDPLLANTDIQKWSSDPWSVATCFINTSGYKDKQSAKDVDCSGLLSLCINNIYIDMLLGEVIIDPFAQVQQNQIEINLEHEVRQLREHGMLTLEKNYQTAKEQHELKLQLIEQQIKDKENELRLMKNLRSAGTQKDLEEHFLLDLQIKVIAKNVEKSTDGNQKVYEVMRDYIKNKYDKTGSPLDVRSTDTPVYHLLDYIKTIEKCNIVNISLTEQSSTDIQINCLSSVAMEDFLKSINCNEFEQELFKLRRWLYVQYDIESHVIIANCSSKGIEKANKRLHFTGVTRNMTCANHQNTQCTLYCPDHDMFFCTACKESKHSTCHGIKQLMSEKSCVEQKRQLNLKSTQGSYNVSINNTLINRDSNDKSKCHIFSMCMLPNGEVLLADSGNKRLKKLNSSYKVISYCDVTAIPLSVCYIGNDTAVASLGDAIQYVNVSGNITRRQLVELNHNCYGLACLGDILYVHSDNKIYKFDKDKCEQKYVLYQLSKNLHTVPYMFAIAISDNGERVYFGTNTGLTTIDAEGNHIFSSYIGDKYDACIAGEGIVLVFNTLVYSSLLQLDYNGKKHRTVELNSKPFDTTSMYSMCFDRERCRLIVGSRYDMIYVYNCEILPS